MFSIMNGYKNRVSPLLIGSKFNLKMIHRRDSSITINELVTASNYTAEQSSQEYFIFKSYQSGYKTQCPVSSAYLTERFYESKLYTE
jgi:hypothetical protein